MGKVTSLTMTTLILPTAEEDRRALTTEGVLQLADILSIHTIMISIKMNSRWLMTLAMIATTQTTIMVEDRTMAITRTRLLRPISMVSRVGSSKASTARITVLSLCTIHRSLSTGSNHLLRDTMPIPHTRTMHLPATSSRDTLRSIDDCKIV